MFNEEFRSLSPVNFFALAIPCRYVDSIETKCLGTSYYLPNVSNLCGEMAFATVALGWSKEGIMAQVQIEKPIEHVSYPDIQKGDSVEFFFDTRNVKTSGFNTRFCHHFFFLPETVDGHLMGEKTHFRTEDAHEWCEPLDLKLQVQRKKKSYIMQIFIPQQCLYGYDADQFDWLGFTYRINAYQKPSQHFSVLSKDYQIEQQPSLWSSLKLIP